MTAATLRSSLWFRQRFGDGETDIHFDNSGLGALQVPGFGLPIDLELKSTERFAHGASDWAQPRLTAREMAMLRLINCITDRSGWHIEVLNSDESEPLVTLRQEALNEFLISPAAWEWCIAELRDKSAILKESGLISVFDSASCIVKSDDLIPKSVLNRFRVGISSLLAGDSTLQVSNESQEFLSTWGDRTADLVDPNMFPLVYGKTKVLYEGTALEQLNALASIGQGQTAPSPEPSPDCEPLTLTHDHFRTKLMGYGDIWAHWRHARPYRYSHTSQWLPCEVSFSGKQDTPSVKITSYINNLHPTSYTSLYADIEEVISLSIKPWNQVLVWRGRHRKPPRIRCYGVPWVPRYPTWAYALPAISRDPTSVEFQEAKQKVEQFLAISDHRTGKPGFLGSQNYDLDKKGVLHLAMQQKHLRLKTGWEHPEPGEAFNYTKWKSGLAGAAVVPKMYSPPGTNNRRPLLSQSDHEFYTIALQDNFREQGLQVVVKLNTVELDPQNPSFTGTDWQIDGLLNEHIVASSIICLSSVNTTAASISFRVEADLDPGEHFYEPFQRTELASVLDLPHANDLGSQTGGCPALQNLGSVLLTEGRLVAVPNVLQRRMEPFELEDIASGPGHKRFITLYLVDPHYRVCSTRNVPPQQHEWWWDASGGDQVVASWAARGVPQEVADKIRNQIGEWPIGMDEAQKIRNHRRMDEMLGNMAVQMGVQKYKFN